MSSIIKKMLTKFQDSRLGSAWSVYQKQIYKKYSAPVASMFSSTPVSSHINALLSGYKHIKP